MSIELPSPSESYIGYTRILLKSIISGFRYHPFFFMLRNSVDSEDPVYPFAHQLELLERLFARKPLRVLIGDEIGLGKTVSAIMLIKYLFETEAIKKVLILVPRVLIQQWLAELKRFNLNAVQLERDNIPKYHAMSFPYDIYIVSIDLAKREEHRRKILDATWGLIVIDEAHRVGKIGGRETQRFDLVRELIGKQNVNVIMLTATPHRGKPEDYIERLRLVDPHIYASPRELDNERFYRLCMGSIVFRRTKSDVNGIYENKRIFTDCRFRARVVEASEEEKVFHKELVEFLHAKLLQYYDITGERPKALPLLLTLIAKRASSSPRAAIITLDRILQRRAKRIKYLGTDNIVDIEEKLDKKAGLIADALLGYSFEDIGLYEDEAQEAVDADEVLGMFAEECSVLLRDVDDIERLKKLHQLAKSISGERDSRLKSLINVIRGHLENGEKVVVFTEFRDTAEYIFNELKKRLPRHFVDKMAMITSKEVIPPPPYGGQKKYGIEDVKRWLRKGDVHLLISTDVASEGLNLQVASVVIHYEPTWSPVKMVQRVGRVWRLGQERDVHSYSLLLAVESDIAVFEVLYAKLLSWLISGVEKRVNIGEELEIDMLPKDKSAYDILQIPLTTESGRPQYSEYRAWIEFIAGGKEGLMKYIGRIIEALTSLREQARRLGLTEIEQVKVENFLNEGLGKLYGVEAEASLKNLLIAVARLHGSEVEEKGSGLYIKGTHLVGLRTQLDMYKALESLLGGTENKVGDEKPVILLARKPSLKEASKIRELYLYEIMVSVGGRHAHSETIGVIVKEDGSTEISRGPALLRILSELISGIVGIVDRLHEEKFEKRLREYAENETLFKYLNRVVNDYSKYLDGVEERFSSQHRDWIPRGNRDVSASSKLLGVIVTIGGVHETHPPPIYVKEVERKAMEYAMAFERSEGRDPEDVSEREHYDIRSVDRRTGEVRYIEVKGRWHLDVAVELTETEYEYSRRLGDNYWLYVVYGFSTGNPRLLMIRDPINRARWITVEVKRYRLLGV